MIHCQLVIKTYFLNFKILVFYEAMTVKYGSQGLWKLSEKIKLHANILLSSVKNVLCLCRQKDEDMHCPNFILFFASVLNAFT